jgi:hypothetical protein
MRMDKVRRNVHQLSRMMLASRLGNMVLIDVVSVGSFKMHAVRLFVMEAFRLHRELSGRGLLYNRCRCVFFLGDPLFYVQYRFLFKKNS